MYLTLVLAIDKHELDARFIGMHALALFYIIQYR